jgi:hypothetical protein
LRAASSTPSGGTAGLSTTTAPFIAGSSVGTKDGVLKELWALMVIECDDLGVDSRWPAADSCSNKSRFDGDKRGRNPTDRAKPGTKKRLIVERSGGPLGVEMAGANVHDKKLLKEPIEAIVVDRPGPRLYPQHLLLDKGYDPGVGVCKPWSTPRATSRTFVRIGEEKLDSLPHRGYASRPGKRRPPAPERSIDV